MPANLQKFGTPWTPLKKSLVTNGQICRVRSLPGSNGKVCTYSHNKSCIASLNGGGLGLRLKWYLIS